MGAYLCFMVMVYILNQNGHNLNKYNMWRGAFRKFDLLIRTESDDQIRMVYKGLRLTFYLFFVGFVISHFWWIFLYW